MGWMVLALLLVFKKKKVFMKKSKYSQPFSRQRSNVPVFMSVDILATLGR